MKSSNLLNQRNNKIDELRAFSFFLVFFYHAGYLEAGYVGVDLFFILSGYLMTNSIILTNKSQGIMGIITFLKKRMARLLPSMLILTVFTVMFSYILVPDSGRGEILRTALTVLTASTNYYLALTQDYFGMSALFNPFTHMWSISAEIHFYLIIAILGFIFRFKALGWMLLCSSLICLSIYLGGESSQNYLFTHTRILSFFLGTVIYFIFAKQKSLYNLSSITLILLYFGVLLSSFIKFPFILGGFDWLFNSIIANLFGMCILLCIINFDNQDQKSSIFSHSLKNCWRYIGRISYSLYLFHFPIISFSFWLWGDINPVSLIIVLGISLIVASINYHLVESKYYNWSYSKKIIKNK